MSIYLDNNSSTFPKLPTILTGISRFIETVGVIPRESGGNSLTRSSGTVFTDAKIALAKLLHVNPSNILLTPNYSDTLMKMTDLLLSPGDRVIMSKGDPLESCKTAKRLVSRQIRIVKVPLNRKYGVSPVQIKKVSGAKVCILSHVNTITGAVIPVDKISNLLSDNSCFILDISDSIGAMPIDLSGMGVDFAVFTTNKHLFGMGGVSGVYINPRIADKYSSLNSDYLETRNNVLSVVPLRDGTNFVLNEGVDRIFSHIRNLRNTLQGVLEMCRQVQIVAPNPAKPSPIMSFTVNRLMPNTIAGMLEERFGIIVGHGLCGNPGGCKSLKLHPEGVLRVGLGFLNTVSDIEYLGTSIDRISRES